MKHFLIFFFCSILFFRLSAAPDVKSVVQIIPQPNNIKLEKGSFLLRSSTNIAYSGGDEAKLIAEQFATMLSRSSGYQFEVTNKANGKSLILFRLDMDLGSTSEMYKLTVTPTQILVSATSAHGLFNGLQSLRQLFPAAIESANNMPTNWSMPCLRIEDKPRYSYRGLHLDVSRHFFDKAFIKKYIDMMSMYKFNTFHWHLTDDQGWRVEVKKYPRLTKLSAFRTECAGDTTGGFYTQNDIKEVVEYAKAHYVEVIPEIEMPGHAVAVLAAYPELSCSGGPFNVPTTWGIFHDVFCAGNDKTFEFLEGVLDEIIPLFPNKYIHIGGDECKKTRWVRCMKCQSRMKVEGLADEHKLQSYFINRIEKYVQPKGKQIIGWDEILEGGVSSTSTIMSWRGTKGGIEAAKHGNDVIMTPGTHCYFDFSQGVESEEPRAFPNRFLPLQKVYTFDPTPMGLTPEQEKHILGGQANLWTEFMASSNQVEYMLFPRALALIECLWTNSANKSYPFFEQKVIANYDRLSRRNINFSRSAERESTIKKWNELNASKPK